MAGKRPTAKASTTLWWVRHYIAQGMLTIPMPLRTKNPILKEWQKLVITEANAAQYFYERMNIGLLCGHNDLSDIDLDAIEAVHLAPHFLLETHRVSGRAGKPRSHWWYRISGGDRSKYEWKDPAGGMIVELRLGKKKYVQTVVPNSIHESGEDITWDEEGEIADAELRIRSRGSIGLLVPC